MHADNSFTILVPVKFMDWSRLSLICLTVTQFLERHSSWRFLVM